MMPGIGPMPRRLDNNGLSRRKAFSLIELLLVIVLLGVVAAVSVPNFSKTYGRLRLKQTAENVQYLMNYAQSRAIIKNLSFRLQWEEGFRRCRLTEEAVRENGSPRERVFQKISGRWGREISFPSEIQVTSSLSQFEFYPDGTIDKGTISVCGQKNCYTISTQEKRGRVRMFSAGGKDVNEEIKN